MKPNITFQDPFPPADMFGLGSSWSSRFSI